MPDQNEMDIALRIEADASAAKKTEARVDKIISGLKTLEKQQTDDSSKAAIEQEIKLYEQEGFAIEQANEELERQVTLKKAIGGVTVAPAQTARAGGGGVVGEAEFSETSKRVALLGDAESNINAIGGAIGTLGGEAGVAVEGVLRIGAELFATAEAAPKLVASLKGAPAALKAAALSTLGLQTAETALVPASAGATAGIVSTTVAMGPLVVVGLALVAVAATLAIGFDAIKTSGEDAAKEMQIQVAAQQEYNEALTSTSDVIQEQITANEDLAAINQRNLDDINERIAALNEPSDIFFGLGDALGVVGQEGDQLNDKLKELEEEQKELSGSTEALTEALSSSEVAERDRTAALLENVDQIAEAREFEQDALESSAEANEKRAEAIDKERAIIEEQIAAIEQGGDTSAEAQAKLSELNGELENLDQQSATLTSSAVLAAEAERVQADATDDLAAASDAAANDIANAAKKTASAKASEAKANAAANDAIAKADGKVAELKVKQQQDLLKLDTDQGNKIIEQQKDADKKRLEAKADFEDDFDKLTDEGSFLAAFARQEEIAKELTESQTAEAEKIADLRDGFKVERTEKLAALAEQRADAEQAAAEQIASADERRTEAAAKTAEAEKEEAAVREKARQEEAKIKEDAAKEIARIESKSVDNTNTVMRRKAETETQLQRQVLQNTQEFAGRMSGIFVDLFNNIESNGSAAGDGGGSSAGRKVTQRMLGQNA